MAEDRKLMVGIDLSSEYIQASCYYKGMKEPESVILGVVSQTYYIKNLAYKKIGENKWAFGDTGRQYFEKGEYLKVDNIIEKVIDGNTVSIDDEEYMPVDILECLIRFVARECIRVSDAEKISKIAICVDNFKRRLLDNVKTVLNRMSFGEDDILLMNRTESFIYYTLNAPEELYQRGVGMFDFSGDNLRYSYMNYTNVQGKTIVMVDSCESRIMKNGEKEVDRQLADIASKVMGNSQMSSIYLVGSGFEEYEHLDAFIKTACNRKRAFIGQNMYAKGAALGCFEHFYGGNYKNRILACEDRVLCDIDIDITEREKPKVYRAVKVGTNWYMAGKRLRFIVDDTDELKLHIHPIERKPDQEVTISLEDFPKRADRMTKLMLSLEFDNAGLLRLELKDMGFGDICKATDKTVYKDIRL